MIDAMGKESGNPVVRDAVRVLGEERLALLSGRVSDLSEVSLKKEAILHKMRASHEIASDVDLKTVRAMMTKNQSLYEFALAGISSASERISALRSPEKHMNVYDAKGKSESISYTSSGPRV